MRFSINHQLLLFMIFYIASIGVVAGLCFALIPGIDTPCKIQRADGNAEYILRHNSELTFWPFFTIITVFEVSVYVYFRTRQFVPTRDWLNRSFDSLKSSLVSVLVVSVLTLVVCASLWLGMFPFREISRVIITPDYASLETLWSSFVIPKGQVRKVQVIRENGFDRRAKIGYFNLQLVVSDLDGKRYESVKLHARCDEPRRSARCIKIMDLLCKDLCLQKK